MVGAGRRLEGADLDAVVDLALDGGSWPGAEVGDLDLKALAGAAQRGLVELWYLCCEARAVGGCYVLPGPVGEVEAEGVDDLAEGGDPGGVAGLGEIDAVLETAGAAAADIG